MMNSFSPGLMRPSSRRAISDGAGSSRRRRASSRRPAFRSQPRQVRSQLIVLFPGPDGGHQAPIAHERVHGEDADHEAEESMSMRRPRRWIWLLCEWVA
jgi:hypothetical protein